MTYFLSSLLQFFLFAILFNRFESREYLFFIMKSLHKSILVFLFYAGLFSAYGKDSDLLNSARAVRKGDAVQVDFTVKKPVDVAVAVLDGKGNVLRHLGAGQVGGEHPPAPFVPEKLSQSIVWDGRDDFGKEVDLSACRVRIQCGLKPEFGKVVACEPGIGYSARAAAVGPDGLVYVLQEHARIKSTFILQAYTRNGKYVKTIMPYPADLPPERLKGLRRFKKPDGTYWPGVFNPSFRDLYPRSTGMRPQRMLITSTGWIVLCNSSKTHNGGWPYTHHLLVVDTDGGTPMDEYLGPWTSVHRLNHGLCWIAMSPDEKWFYTCGQRKGNSDDDGYRTPKHNVVYRVRLTDRGRATPFIGKLFRPGSDEQHLKNPYGIDTDAQGNIYVADNGNNRIAVFDSSGKWKGKIDVPRPNQVLVNKKNGVVYVYSFVKKAGRIQRFKGIGANAADADVSVPGPYCALTLDTSTDTPTLWLAYSYGERPPAGHQHRGVARVEDRDGKLSDPILTIRQRKLPDVYQIGASMKNDDVFVHSYSEHRIFRVNGITGETRQLKLRGYDLAVGPQGAVYLSDGRNIKRFDRNGKPMPFDGKSHVLRNIASYVGGHNRTDAKGFSVSPRGNIAGMHGKGRISLFGPDGSIIRKHAVIGLTKAGGSPVEDISGNIYVAANLRHWHSPPIFKGRPPSSRYYVMYGSVIKFPASGGKLLRKPIGFKGDAWPDGYKEEDVLRLKAPGVKEAAAIGANWARSGFTTAPSGGNICGCYTSRFTVDYYGRVFLPDVGRFCVHAVDAANNYLYTIGDYGNEDSGGPDSRIAVPEIPLAWPYAISVGKSGVYISDFINRRIVRADLKAAAERIVEVK